MISALARWEETAILDVEWPDPICRGSRSEETAETAKTAERHVLLSDPSDLGDFRGSFF
jgi:hypothetical protein